ncbi:MAG: hypothetical protein EXR36_02520 [Betaproteobacteria bacterium]|nr:hypothetical protein [Betaproteobacteria bacterium]
MSPRPIGDHPPEEDPRVIAAYQDASTDEPSASIDATLRAAARRAAGSRPHAPGNFRLGIWQAPLAAAAIVVLSTTVVFWTVREEGLGKLSQPPSAEEAGASRDSSPPKIERQEKLAQMKVPSPPPSAPAPVRNRAATSERGYAFEADPALAKKLESSPAKVQPAPALRDQFAKEAGSPATSVSAAEADQSLTVRRGSMAPEKRKMDQAQSERADSEDKALQREEPPTTAQAQPASATPPVESKDSSVPPENAGAASSMREERVEPPAQCIERVEHLLREGKRTQAMEALAAFRKTYPAYTLPDALAQLEREMDQPR